MFIIYLEETVIVVLDILGLHNSNLDISFGGGQVVDFEEAPPVGSGGLDSSHEVLFLDITRTGGNHDLADITASVPTDAEANLGGQSKRTIVGIFVLKILTVDGALRRHFDQP